MCAYGQVMIMRLMGVPMGVPMALLLMGRRRMDTSTPREVPDHSGLVTGTSPRLLFMLALRPPCLKSSVLPPFFMLDLPCSWRPGAHGLRQFVQ